MGRAGWKLNNPFSIVTLQGSEQDLLDAPPAMVKQWFYRDYSQNRAGPGQENSVELVSITKMLNSCGREAIRPEEWPSSQRHSRAASSRVPYCIAGDWRPPHCVRGAASQTRWFTGSLNASAGTTS